MGDLVFKSLTTLGTDRANEKRKRRQEALDEARGDVGEYLNDPDLDDAEREKRALALAATIRVMGDGAKTTAWAALNDPDILDHLCMYNVPGGWTLENGEEVMLDQNGRPLPSRGANVHSVGGGLPSGAAHAAAAGPAIAATPVGGSTGPATITPAAAAPVVAATPVAATVAPATTATPVTTLTPSAAPPVPGTTTTPAPAQPVQTRRTPLHPLRGVPVTSPPSSP